MDAFLNFLIFPKISALSQKLALVQNQFEKLGEVYTINFLIVMYDLKLRIKAGTSKNRYNRISERSLALPFFIGSSSFLQVTKTAIKAWMGSKFGKI